MRPTIKFLIGLILRSALLTWGTAALVQRTTRNWFQDDVRLRGELVVRGAQETLSADWSREQRTKLERMRAMRAFAEFNVYLWAGRLLVDAARFRCRGRSTDRLAEQLPGANPA